ncbi:MAG: hypothetical protein DBW72_04160 [Flavobacteriales bacterium]|nr:MAG: hypothetical protein DBW72_04160 [Flavobacteriales bacterium]
MKYFYLLTVVSLLQSCVVYYNTDEIRNSMNNNIAQIEGNYSIAKADFTEKNELYNGLKSNVLDINDGSFKLLSEKKNSFDDAYQNLLDKKEAMNKTKNQFDHLIEGKNEIKSNEKEWGELKEIKSTMKTYAKEMNELGNSYATSSNNLSDAINNSQYKQIKKIEFNRQIRTNTKELNESIADITNQISSYKDKLEIANDNRQMIDSTYQVKMGLLKNISTELTKIQSSVKRITAFESSFQLKNKKMDKVWIGENTKSNELMIKIEYSITDINNGISKIQAISANLNEADQE